MYVCGVVWVYTAKYIYSTIVLLWGSLLYRYVYIVTWIVHIVRIIMIELTDYTNCTFTRAVQFLLSMLDCLVLWYGNQ